MCFGDWNQQKLLDLDIQKKEEVWKTKCDSFLFRNEMTCEYFQREYKKEIGKLQSAQVLTWLWVDKKYYSFQG